MSCILQIHFPDEIAWIVIAWSMGMNSCKSALMRIDAISASTRCLFGIVPAACIATTARGVRIAFCLPTYETSNTIF